MKSLHYVKMTCAVSLVFALMIAGCGGGGPTNGGDDAKYALEVMVEKNLDEGQDHLYIRFLRDGISITEGYVIVDGDSLATSASGQASQSYSSSRYSHGQTVAVTAVDPEESFTHSTSVTIPSTFTVEVTSPANLIWQPNKGNVSLTWLLATPVVGYILSVDPRKSGTTAPGLTEIISGGSHSFVPEDVFYNQQTSELVSDFYDVKIVAYNGSFVRRTGAPYRSPDIAFPLTIDEDQISGRVGALVVSSRKTIQAMPL